MSQRESMFLLALANLARTAIAHDPMHPTAAAWGDVLKWLPVQRGAEPFEVEINDGSEAEALKREVADLKLRLAAMQPKL